MPNLLPALLMGIAMLSVIAWIAFLLLKAAWLERHVRKDEYQGLLDALLRHAATLEEIMDNG
jgi:ABC-type transport system involved in cytochrome c biogenesis permease component